MPKIDPIPLILAVGAVVPLMLLVPAFKRARSAGDVDSSAILTFAMGWLVSLPIVLVVISGGLERRVDAFSELIPVLPAWYQTLLDGCLAILILLAGVLVMMRMISEGRNVPVNAAGLFAIVLWLVAHLASGLHGGPLLTLSGAALLMCLVAATVLPRGRGACVGIGFFGVTLGIGSLILATLNYDVATVPCRHVCVLGASLTGLLPNENLLGTAILATLPFAYLGFREPERKWLVAFLAAVGIVSGSRGALLVGLVVLVVLFVVRPALDADRRRPGPTALASLVLAGALLASVYVVQHDWGGSSISLTDRPQLWSVATGYIDESPLFGYGPYEWENLYKETGEIPMAAQHSTHNQWIDVLFTAGWVGTGLLVAMIVAALWSARYARPAVLTILAALLLIGVTERAWSIGVIDFVSFSLVGLILLGPARATERSAPSAHPVRARSERLLADVSS